MSDKFMRHLAGPEEDVIRTASESDDRQLLISCVRKCIWQIDQHRSDVAALESQLAAAQALWSDDPVKCEAALVANILRTWDKVRIERFALHLLGDNYEAGIAKLRAELAAAQKQVKEYEEQLIASDTQYYQKWTKSQQQLREREEQLAKIIKMCDERYSFPSLERCINDICDVALDKPTADEVTSVPRGALSVDAIVCEHGNDDCEICNPRRSTE